MRQQMPTQFKLPLNTHSTRISSRRRRRMHYPVQRVWFIDARALSFQLFSGCLSCFVYCECVWRHTHWHTHLVYLFKCAWALMKNPASAAWKNICACAQSAIVSSVWRLWQCVGPGCHCHCSCWKIGMKINLNSSSIYKYVHNMANTWSANGYRETLKTEYTPGRVVESCRVLRMPLGRGGS